MDDRYERRTKEIIAGMSCRKNCECYKSNNANCDSSTRSVRDEVIWCMDDNAQSCDFSLSYGSSYICRCPLQLHLAGGLTGD
jgi:hypothetical protein